MKKLTTILSIAFLLIFTGCNNLISPSSFVQEEKQQGKALISFGVETMTNQEARLVLPDEPVYEKASLQEIKITGWKKNASGEYESEQSFFKNYFSYRVFSEAVEELDAGVWKFTISAKQGDLPLLRGEIKEITLTEGANAPICFTLSAEIPETQKNLFDYTFYIPKVNYELRVTATLIMSMINFTPTISDGTGDYADYTAIHLTLPEPSSAEANPKSPSALDFLSIEVYAADPNINESITDTTEESIKHLVASHFERVIYKPGYTSKGFFVQDKVTEYVGLKLHTSENKYTNITVKKGFKLPSNSTDSMIYWYTDAACTTPATVVTGEVTELWVKIYPILLSKITVPEDEDIWLEPEFSPDVMEYVLKGFNITSDFTLSAELISASSASLDSSDGTYTVSSSQDEPLEIVVTSTEDENVSITYTITYQAETNKTARYYINKVPTYPDSSTAYDIEVEGECTYGDYETLVKLLSKLYGKNYNLDLSATTGLTSVKKICDNSGDNIVSLSLPDSVTSIGDEAFNDWRSLKSVHLGSGTKTIGRYAFFNCTFLTSIDLPEGLTTISECAFWKTAIESLTLPASLTEIMPCALYGIEELKTLSLAEGNTSYVLKNGLILSADETELIECACIPDFINAKAKIPSGVTKINFQAFYDLRKNLGSCIIDIPDTVTEIQEEAFWNTIYKGLVLPKNVSIGENVFNYGSGTTATTVIFYRGTETEWDELLSGIPKSNTLLFNGTVLYADEWEYDETTDTPLITALKIIPQEATIMKNDATAKLYATLSEGVTWESSNEKVVTVSETGKLTGIGPGYATITARTADGRSATASITVPGAVFSVDKILFTNINESKEITVTFIPENEIGTVLTSTNDIEAEKIDSNTIRVTNKAASNCTLMVWSKTGDYCDIKTEHMGLTSSSCTALKGDDFYLGICNKSSNTFNWDSNDENIVTINNPDSYEQDGLLILKAVAPGTATITGTTTDGLTTSCEVTVLDAECTLTAEKSSISIGESTGLVFSSGNENLSYEISDFFPSDKATVNSETSTVTALKAGSVTVQANIIYTHDGIKEKVSERSVTITVTGISFWNDQEYVAQNQKFSLVIDKIEVTDTINWVSDNPDIVSISNDPNDYGGVYTIYLKSGTTAGTATITGTTESGLSCSCEITVIDATISLSKTQIAVGERTQVIITSDIPNIDYYISEGTSDLTVDGETRNITGKAKGVSWVWVSLYTDDYQTVQMQLDVEITFEGHWYKYSLHAGDEELWGNRKYTIGFKDSNGNYSQQPYDQGGYYNGNPLFYGWDVTEDSPSAVQDAKSWDTSNIYDGFCSSPGNVVVFLYTNADAPKIFAKGQYAGEDDIILIPEDTPADMTLIQ